MSEPLTYSDLEFPNFVNSNSAMTLRARESATKDGMTSSKDLELTLSLSDVIKAGVLAGLPQLYIGDTRCGKSLACMDIHRHYFGGDADSKGRSNWNTARNDFSAEAYFLTIDQSKIGPGKGMLTQCMATPTRPENI